VEARDDSFYDPDGRIDLLIQLVDDAAQFAAALKLALQLGPTAPVRRRRRRWLWVLAAATAATVGLVVALVWFTGSPAKQVSLNQAESRLPSGQPVGPLGSRPSPGVYQYVGSGTDRLSLPSESQPEGPSMPGTITLRGEDCWTFRIDYSTHHWQSWDFCRRGSEMRKTGGQVWQLWPLGPMSLTNTSSVVCTPEVPILPARPATGQTWTGSCSATSSAVKGQMEATAVYRYLAPATVVVDGRSLPAERLSITQTDRGAQKGTESYQMWVEPRTGLILRLDQDIKVTSATPVGTSTYTQNGTFSLSSLVAHQG
jgi:hypothetical protein